MAYHLYYEQPDGALVPVPAVGTPMLRRPRAEAVAKRLASTAPPIEARAIVVGVSAGHLVLRLPIKIRN